MSLHHIVAQGVSGAHSFHPLAIHDVTCLSVRLLSLRVCLFLVSLPLLPVLCPAHHLQCRHRRGLKPLHSRTMRSSAPWRKTILSQVSRETCFGRSLIKTIRVENLTRFLDNLLYSDRLQLIAICCNRREV